MLDLLKVNVKKENNKQNIHPGIPLKFEQKCIDSLVHDGDKKVTAPKKLLRRNGFSFLGKDEVASSNLASSSNITPKEIFGVFLFLFQITYRILS